MDDADIEEEAWFAEERRKVEEYLRHEGVEHLGVDEVPAFHVHPYMAVWAVQSKVSPGRVGWWAFSGDLPTDYISRKDAKDPREALDAVSRHWKELAGYMIRGEAHPEVIIGPPERWPQLGDLLQKRAEFIASMVADDEIWEDDEL
jgi:hypothetical protein